MNGVCDTKNRRNGVLWSVVPKPNIHEAYCELDEKDDKQFRTLDLPELAIEVEPITKPKVDGMRDFMRSISS